VPGGDDAVEAWEEAMRYRRLSVWLAVALGVAHMGDTASAAQRSTSEEWQHMSSFTGKIIRWRFADGPSAGTLFEHEFHEDGSVTWRIVDGEHKGASAREKSYVAVKVNERTWAVSYLAASGHTLTVVLDFGDSRAFGFASDAKSSYSFNGTFELVN
jgi:hypothetical protein